MDVAPSSTLLLPLTTFFYYLLSFFITCYLFYSLTTTFVNQPPLPLLYTELHRSLQLLPCPLPDSLSSKSSHERQFFAKNLQLFSYVYVELAGGIRQLGLVWEKLRLATVPYIVYVIRIRLLRWLKS